MKWTLIVLTGLIGLILLTALTLYSIGKKKLTRSYPNIPVESVTIPTDANAIARGKHVSIIWGCTQCHDEDLSGKVFTKDPIGGTISIFGVIPASNLTSGNGGVGKRYTDVDWIRAIRHGIKPNSHPEVFMYVTAMSDRDLGDLIAYLKQVSPIDTDTSVLRYGPIIPIASALGVFPPVAGLIDHSSKHMSDPAPAATIEYGRYLSAICAQCHTNGLALKMKKWKQEDFIRTFQSGILPNGKQFGTTMSSKTFRDMNQMELSALWLYLQSQ